MNSGFSARGRPASGALLAKRTTKLRVILLFRILPGGELYVRLVNWGRGVQSMIGTLTREVAHR
jgi:hypothetical protein